MGPKIKRVDQSTIATPVAEDFLKVLEGQIARGTFGAGIGPLQREAGTAIRQFVNSGLDRVNTGGIDPGTSALIDALTTRSQTATNRSAADLRESFGIAGNRFGTSVAKGEGMLRGEAQTGLDQTVGGILQQQHQFNIASLMQAINEMSRQGSANINPFVPLFGLGINPDEIIASPGVGQQLLAGGLNIAGEFAGRS